MSTNQQISNLLHAALSAQQQGNMAGAEEACKNVLDIDPRQPDALQFLGLIAESKGDLETAETLMVRSLEANPNQPHVLNNLGNLHHKKGAGKKALSCLEKAIAMQPGYWDAWYNLGKINFDLGNYDDSEKALLKARENWPYPDPRPHTMLGNLARQRGDFDAANRFYEEALARTPNYFNALHNYGLSLKIQQRFGDALELYNKALAVSQGVPELFYNLGNLFFETNEIDKAIENYRKAIALRPDYAEAHTALNEVLWRAGEKGDYLASYGEAIALAPGNLDLHHQFIERLIRAEKHSDAAAEVDKVFESGKANAETWHLKGLCLVALGDGPGAFEAMKTSVELAPTNVIYRKDICRLLIKVNKPAEALKHMEAAREVAPFNQEILGYLELCWRLTGNPRHKWLNDYETFVRPYQIPVPEGYKDIAEFNQALNTALDAFHTTKNQPSDQTLLGGTQTIAALLDRNVKEIQEARRAFEMTIKRYIEDLPDDPDHPLLSRKCDKFTFAGSWSVRLRNEGFHVNHTHREGWISACYYVSLPEIVKRGEDHQGWIKFGESPLALGERDHIGKIVQPQEGLLVLFPSYMFHGTVPFRSNETRTTFPFDVVPLGE